MSAEIDNVAGICPDHFDATCALRSSDGLAALRERDNLILNNSIRYRVLYNGYKYWEDFFYDSNFDDVSKPNIGHLHAAIARNTDPVRCLNDARLFAQELVDDEEFSYFSVCPSIYFLAAFTRTLSAKDYLRSVRAEVESIVAEDEFSHFSNKLGVVISFVSASFKSARQLLLDYKYKTFKSVGYSPDKIANLPVDEVNDLMIDVASALKLAQSRLSEDLALLSHLELLPPTVEVRTKLEDLLMRLENFAPPEVVTENL